MNATCHTGKIQKQYLKYSESSSLHVYVQTYIFDDVNLREQSKKKMDKKIKTVTIRSNPKMWNCTQMPNHGGRKGGSSIHSNTLSCGHKSLEL